MSDTPMTDKLINAMAREIERWLDDGLHQMPGQMNEEHWHKAGQIFDVEKAARAALTAALAEIEGTELAIKLRIAAGHARDIRDEAADALDLLTAERERDRALLGEALRYIQSFGEDEDHENAWCVSCGKQAPEIDDIGHKDGCFVVRITAALGENDG